YYYGFHGHIVINSTGVITGGTFAAANIDERDVCPELLVGKINNGLLLGDKGFIRPILKQELTEHGTYLETPLKKQEKTETISFT
ncbi:MAG: transposase, partial [Waddliaceae bacterium]